MNYNKGYETKKKFILSTYEKLQESDAGSLTVRELAKENGCSAAALYRYFESLDYLISVSSVRFLDEYMRQYAKLMDEEKDFERVYVKGWELFVNYAFLRPDIYYRLFWGKENSVFDTAFQDYFELFPFSGSEKYTAQYYTLLFNENIQERDYMMLRPLIHLKKLKDSQALFLSYTNPLIAKGLILEAISAGEREREHLKKMCSELIGQNTGQMLQLNGREITHDCRS